MTDKLIKLGKKHNINIEVFNNSDKQVVIDSLNDKITKFEYCDIAMYRIKAIKDLSCVILDTEYIDNPKSIIDYLLDEFLVQENTNKNEMCSESISCVNKDENIDYDNVKKDILSLNDYHNIDNRIKDIQVSYIHNYSQIKIDNQKAKLVDSSYSNEFYISITASVEENTKIIDFSLLSRDYDFGKIKEKMNEKINILLSKFTSVSVETKKYDVILNNNVMSDLLECFTNCTFMTKGIVLNQSILANSLNKKVFSDKISIVEDPTNEKFVGKRLFDNEGTITKYKEIVKNGVFLKSLNNIEYAIKNNEEKTGNSYGVRNMYIVSGNNTYNQLISQLNNGIIITSVAGTHAGINELTGDISLQAEGQLVVDGKIQNYLSMIILSTNIIELFNNVSCVGNDLEFFDRFVGSPSILFKNITISGKK